MPLTAGQKLSVIAMPVAAIGLAVVTSGPDWSPPRARYGSLRELSIALAAPPAAPESIKLPPLDAEPAPEKAPKAEPAGKKEPAAKKDPATPKPEGKVAVPAPPASKEPPTPGDGGIEFRTSGLATVRFAEPLRAEPAQRLDIHVLQSGQVRVGTDFSDAEGVKEAIQAADAARKESGLLYVIPNARTPWTLVKDVLDAGFAAGWSKVGLCVAFAEDAGRGRVLKVSAPTNDEPAIAKGLDAVLVKIGGAGPSPSYTLNGAPCADPAGLAFNAKAIHDEYEVMEKDYSADVESTPWTLDATGASAGGVISALDALTTAGVKTVRIQGLKKPAK